MKNRARESQELLNLHNYVVTRGNRATFASEKLYNKLKTDFRTIS